MGKQKIIRMKIIVAFILLGYAGIVASQINVNNELKKDVTFLASDVLEGRNTGTKGELLAAGYIMGKFYELGLLPKGENGYLQEFSVKPKYSPHSRVKVDTTKAITGRNIIGYIDNNATKTIVIGAHYDHLGFGDEGSLYTGNDSIHNGADDNASGVASIIQLARILKEKNKGNNYLFIAFSGEEKGLWGSGWFVKHPTIELSTINYMINLDMVGRLAPDMKLLVYGTGTSPVWNEELDKNIAGKFHLIKKESGVGPSDHMSFYLQDIPVLHFFTGQHDDYHKPTDDADKVNVEGMASIINLIDVVISDLDGSDKLAFTKTKDEESEKAPKYSVTLGVIPDYMFEGEGMRIDGVKENQPAQLAGIQKGDVVTVMGDIPIKTMMDYVKSLSQFKKGDKTTVTILRNNKEKITVEVQF